MKIHGRMEYMEGKLRAKERIHKVRQEVPQHLTPNSILQHPCNWLLLEGSWASLACSLDQPHCSFSGNLKVVSRLKTLLKSSISFSGSCLWPLLPSFKTFLRQKAEAVLGASLVWIFSSLFSPMGWLLSILQCFPNSFCENYFEVVIKYWFS